MFWPDSKEEKRTVCAFISIILVLVVVAILLIHLSVGPKSNLLSYKTLILQGPIEAQGVPVVGEGLDGIQPDVVFFSPNEPDGGVFQLICHIKDHSKLPENLTVKFSFFDAEGKTILEEIHIDKVRENQRSLASSTHRPAFEHVPQFNVKLVPEVVKNARRYKIELREEWARR